MIIRLLTVIGLLSAAAPAIAADTTQTFALRGVALTSCEQFLKAMQERQENVLVAGGWMEGYITAVNQFTADTFDIAPWQSTQVLLGLVARNCERNPQAGFFQIVDSMVKFLTPARLRTQSERVLADTGSGAQMYLYRDTMRDVQTKLIELGFLKGGADGQFGPMTRSALESFQKSQQIEATGLPDQNTLFRLLSPQGG
ncbi:MAG: peptidoglycan-binding protein [Rhodospirillales bacterium]